MSTTPSVEDPSAHPDRARRVWGIGTARTLRAHWMMEELELDYEVKAILPRSEGMRGADIRALTKREKVPILEDDDLVIGESAAISLYLADRYGSSKELAPAPGTRERAIHDELCFFVMTEMDAPLYVIRRHEGLPEAYGESAVACAAARRYFLRSLGEIQRRLARRSAFLCDERFNVADLLVFSCLLWARSVGIEIPSSLDRYFALIESRPALSRALQTNFPPEARAAMGPSN